jgi:hypothetical protein
VSENRDRRLVECFTQANRVADGLVDVPHLLRRVAEVLDGLGDVEVRDVVFHAETDDEGEKRPTMTVYFNRR